MVRAITPFKVIQGHRVWYQSKAHMRRLSLLVLRGLAPIYLPLKTDDLFCSSLSLLLISLGCHPPRGCHPAHFSPVRPHLSTILCKFTHKNCLRSCVTPWRVSSGGSAPASSPSDATAETRIIHSDLSTTSHLKNKVKITERHERYGIWFQGDFVP